MTWVIFSSLAFCAFQIVFTTDLAKDIDDSFSTAELPILTAQFDTDNDILAAADAVKSKEITADQIYNKCRETDAFRKFDESFRTQKDKCQQCYHKAKNTEDIQSAENCCKKIGEEYKKDAKSYLAQAKTCIADLAQKCAKSATECREEATNADKAHEKWTKLQKVGLRGL